MFITCCLTRFWHVYIITIVQQRFGARFEGSTFCGDKKIIFCLLFLLFWAPWTLTCWGMLLKGLKAKCSSHAEALPTGGRRVPKRTFSGSSAFLAYFPPAHFSKGMAAGSFRYFAILLDSRRVQKRLMVLRWFYIRSRMCVPVYTLKIALQNEKQFGLMFMFVVYVIFGLNCAKWIEISEKIEISELDPICLEVDRT